MCVKYVVCSWWPRICALLVRRRKKTQFKLKNEVILRTWGCLRVNQAAVSGNWDNLGCQLLSHLCLSVVWLPLFSQHWSLTPSQLSLSPSAQTLDEPLVQAPKLQVTIFLVLLITCPFNSCPFNSDFSRRQSDWLGFSSNEITKTDDLPRMAHPGRDQSCSSHLLPGCFEVCCLLYRSKEWSRFPGRETNGGGRLRNYF